MVSSKGHLKVTLLPANAEQHFHLERDCSAHAFSLHAHTLKCTGLCIVDVADPPVALSYQLGYSKMKARWMFYTVYSQRDCGACRPETTETIFRPDIPLIFLFYSTLLETSFSETLLNVHNWYEEKYILQLGLQALKTIQGKKAREKQKMWD